MNKRLQKEIMNLLKEQNIDSDFLIQQDEVNLGKIYAICKGPNDSLYRHKFIRLNLLIPDNYPFEPPQMIFVNYNNKRIHPNMYENGKCCATILNTWGTNENEKWTSSMTIKSLLISFMSLFDNDPYTFEPGGKGDESYNTYVHFETWHSCLINYLQYETIEEFRNFINHYLLHNEFHIFKELNDYSFYYTYGWYYCKCFEIDDYCIDYDEIYLNLQYYLNNLITSNLNSTQKSIVDLQDPTNVPIQENSIIKCTICHDTKNYESFKELECGHKFHSICLADSITKSKLNLCPICRHPISKEKLEEIKWIINPLTKKRIKIHGKTFNKIKYAFKS